MRAATVPGGIGATNVKSGVRGCDWPGHWQIMGLPEAECPACIGQ